MTSCREIAEWFDGNWPEKLACDWDNVGLNAGRFDKEVRRVYIALDALSPVVDAAIKNEADMLITHHPLIFGGIKKVNDENMVGKRLIRLIQADISYYAGHTSFDIAKSGMGDICAERFIGGMQVLGIAALPVSPLEVTGQQDGEDVGVGKVIDLGEPVSVNALTDVIKRQFEIPNVTVYCRDPDEKISRIAISPGSGKGMDKEAAGRGAELLVTGDMGHHDGIDLVESGISLIDAGHYGLEHVFVDEVAEKLAAAYPGMDIIKAPISYPAYTA